MHLSCRGLGCSGVAVAEKPRGEAVVHAVAEPCPLLGKSNLRDAVHRWWEVSVEVAGLLFLEVLFETDGVVPLASGALFLVPLVEGEDPLVFDVAGLLVAGILVEVESEILFAAGIRFLFEEFSAAGVLFLCLCPNRLD